MCRQLYYQAGAIRVSAPHREPGRDKFARKRSKDIQRLPPRLVRLHALRASSERLQHTTYQSLSGSQCRLAAREQTHSMLQRSHLASAPSFRPSFSCRGSTTARWAAAQAAACWLSAANVICACLVAGRCSAVQLCIKLMHNLLAYAWPAPRRSPRLACRPGCRSHPGTPRALHTCMRVR